ncbi:MAG: hypothetical protein A2953_00815 [Candidatus Levybacteria bacterium RIFCSPLOWO2_01_FULL_36_54]|nr:MAG: hypothetical protein A3C97_02645 [Candidatus Levybacteria bacterium RIFCSPHIGHO2_02_FULL_37_11]OGH33236.1 MAG: hypothetical protein A2953_00815 [Candidatus Levybacteria bacterium RIFCSPLOWO2_01_FULL_36_54]
MNKLLNLGTFFSIPLMVIASWFLVHIMAIFGIFIAVAYPLWWLFAPKQAACFLCRAKVNEDWCPFCHKVVNKNEGVSPKSITSAVLNGFLILIFSIAFIGVVFGESQILFKLGFPPTPKTVSFIIPTKGQYRLGEIFPMKIEIAGIKTPINAVQADLGFESSKAEVVDISTEGSFANIFIQKEINNDGGYARLTGGLPNPGFFADKGLFGTVFFRGKSPGIVKIEFLPSSKVLANDSRGTEVLKDLASVSYLILPERISKEEDDMQKTIKLSSTVLGVSTGSTQMKFYQEGSVLGAKVGQEIKEEKRFNPLKSSLNILEIIDRFILEQYGKLFGLFKK